MEIAGFAGQVITPADAGYEESRRVWNGAIDRRPAAVARCTGPGDVQVALRHARERDLVVAVRGGGHGVAGTATCDGGLVIDLSQMKAVGVDAERRTARAQAGALWGDLDRATQRHGLATVGGIVSHTGVAGLTLGGGIGWLMRRHGLTVDNMLSATVVTAGGEVVVASEREHPDLFWGLRGGGGNFGIVTEFEYRLHPLGPELLCGPVFWPLEEAGDVLRGYAALAPDLPREVATIVNLRKAPPLPFIPDDVHGRLVCTIVMAYLGDPAAGEAALSPLQSLRTPLVDLVAVRPYGELQSLFDGGVPHGWHYYWKSTELGPLTSAVIDEMVEHTARIGSPRSYSIMFHLGGAVADTGEDATAYSHRTAAHNLNINAVWLPDEPVAEQETGWTRAYFAAVEPHQAGVYVNFLGDEGPDRVRAAYGDAKYRRLVEMKDRWDPHNTFRLNANIQPSRQRALTP